MSKTTKSKFKDLAEMELDNMDLISWRDDELVFLNIGFITISIPLDDFNSFYDFITETQYNLKSKQCNGDKKNE